MRSNRASSGVKATTFEGGKAAAHVDVLAQLERQVATCLLFENTFYQPGSDIALQITAGVEQAVRAGHANAVAELAMRARSEMKLRHVPLFLVRELARHKESRAFVEDTLFEVIRRPDEMAEFISLYWRGAKSDADKESLAASVKRGLARAFTKFSPYQLAKYDRPREIKLRDVLFLVHAKPKDEAQAATWKALVDGKLEAPDTWEVALSAGADKKATWERLIDERKLGIMALLMNCRNMVAAGCDLAKVGAAILEKSPGSWALPFRYLSAAKHAPALAQALSDGMLAALESAERISGKTAVVVDVSGSMDTSISGKSELTRWEAASALAILCRELSPLTRVFTFSNRVVEVPNLRGIALVQAIFRSQQHSGTLLRGALEAILREWPAVERIVVVTDEQSHDGTLQLTPGQRGYIINVAPYRPALETHGGWVRINGWSERVFDWMRWHEGGRITESAEDDGE